MIARAPRFAVVGALVALLLVANGATTAKDKLKCKDFPGPVQQTEQTRCWNSSGTEISCIGTGQDGDSQAGVAWPIPRFTKNGDGTVTDNLTGLIWLEDANCFGQRNWTNALAAANSLFEGSTTDPNNGDCGLSDGSTVGEWRLPNVREQFSLIHFGLTLPALPNTVGTGQWAEGDPFWGVVVQCLQPYWTSSTNNAYRVDAWRVEMCNGATYPAHKSSLMAVWPVRNGK